MPTSTPEPGANVPDKTETREVFPYTKDLAGTGQIMDLRAKVVSADSPEVPDSRPKVAPARYVRTDQPNQPQLPLLDHPSQTGPTPTPTQTGPEQTQTGQIPTPALSVEEVLPTPPLPPPPPPPPTS
jgi:hypothetical protein